MDIGGIDIIWYFMFGIIVCLALADWVNDDRIEYVADKVEGLEQAYKLELDTRRRCQLESKRGRKPVIYLATPYSHPDKHRVELRFEMACEIAGSLMQKGYIVFCPISHTHPVAVHNPDMPQFDPDYWIEFDRFFLEACDEMVIADTMNGWENSRGIQKEIKIAKELGKPIVRLSKLLKKEKINEQR